MNGSRESEKGIRIGWASTSITPDQPVQLDGQHHERVSKYVHDPLRATALALAAGDAQAVIVSCDLLFVLQDVQEGVRTAVARRLTDLGIYSLDVDKMFLAATHTHTAPVTRVGAYPPPGPGVMPPVAYVDWLVERLAGAIVGAWVSCRPGGVSWALGHAAVGYCRRVVYDDGTAQMYGSTDTPRFRNLEGSQDHGVEMLFLWGDGDRPTGVVLNLACPSQVVEMKRYVSADFWGAVRRELTKRYGEGFHVLPLCGAAGDQSPRDLVRRSRGEADMYDESGLQEKAARIVRAVERAFEAAQDAIQSDPVLQHVVQELDLPGREISAGEAKQARLAYEALMEVQPPEGSSDGGRLRRQQAVLARYARQGENPRFRMELHVLRLGEIALATNPFELFLDYGLRIKARSKAQQTFVVQLSCDTGGYLPTAKAVAGGGYGATAAEGLVGPEGGQVLVERTVELINACF